MSASLESRTILGAQIAQNAQRLLHPPSGHSVFEKLVAFGKILTFRAESAKPARNVPCSTIAIDSMLALLFTAYFASLLQETSERFKCTADLTSELGYYRV